MGLVRDTKVSTAAQHAARAVQEGRTVLLYRQNVGATSSGWSGPVGDVAEVIEAIERHGWQLGQIAYDERQSSKGGILMLFRRAASPAPRSGQAYEGYYQDQAAGRHGYQR